VPYDPVGIACIDISDKTEEGFFETLTYVYPAKFGHVPEYGYHFVIYILDAII
jgi:hypothetical protein